MSHFFPPDRTDCDGFVLRSYEPGDGALIADAVNTSYEHLEPWMPWAEPHRTLDDAEQMARRNRGRWLLGEDYTVGIFSPDESRLLGGTGFHLREGGLETASAEIGMFIRASEAGAGLGTRVLRAMLAWGFDAWPWLRLSWICDSRNVASVRVAEKAGMVREGVCRSQAAHVGRGRRDSVLFAALMGEWSDPSAREDRGLSR